MNILLWILQVGLGFVCIAGGSYKITHFELLKKMAASMRALPKGLWVFVGAFEALAGLCLIFPGAIVGMPTLNAVAAAVVAVESAVLSGLYLFYGDKSPLMYTLVGTVLAAFIAYGRFVLKPF